MKPQLNIFVPDSIDCKTLIVQDISIYGPDITVANAILEVTLPSYTCPVIFNVTKGFTKVLSAADLELLQTSNINVSPSLPDGIYKFRFSIDPNLSIFVEKEEFRVCKIYSKLRNAIRKIFKDKCNNTVIFRENLKKLNYIENLIKASVYMVQDENSDTNQAIKLYNEASELLNDIESCETC